MHTVYALVNPCNNEVKYIGRSTRPANRLKDHKTALTGSSVSAWSRNLKDGGLEPEMLFLETDIPTSEIKDAEMFWITYFRSLGADLLNSHGVPEKMKWDRRRKDSTPVVDCGNRSFALGTVYDAKLTQLAKTEGRTLTETIRRALDALAAQRDAQLRNDK